MAKRAMKPDSAPRRVVFILPSLTAGGAERVLIGLMNGLDRGRFEPFLIVVNGKGPLRNLIHEDIPFHDLGGRRVSRSLFKLFRCLKSLKPNIVVSTMAHMNFAVLLMRPFFPKTSFIVREAITPSFILGEHPRLAGLIGAAYRILYPRAHLVFSPAQAIIDEFRGILGMKCKNHKILYNSVDMQRVRAEEIIPDQIAKQPGEGLRFVAAGRLHTQKGFDRLVEALENFQSLPPWRLDILGEGPEREHLETMIREKGLEGRVILRGRQDNPWPWYAAADCFLLPSRHEGLPNVVLESLACGTPVIATAESGGIEEIQSFTPAESLIIAQSMHDFIVAMAGIAPSFSSLYRPSLLPSAFSQEEVMEIFSNFLEECRLGGRPGGTDQAGDI
ncbi:MAG: glycosyltransferase [Alphaproteobacteria bacterium]|nr:glycosyltransferase [Alphaproteobacteria bacterium]